VLYQLGILFENNHYSETARKMVFRMRGEIAQHGVYYSNWACLLGNLVHGTYEVAILGENALPLNLGMQKKYLPTALFAGGVAENLPLLRQRLDVNKTVIYVCQNKTCNLPVYSADDALALIRIH